LVSQIELAFVVCVYWLGDFSDIAGERRDLQVLKHAGGRLSAIVRCKMRMSAQQPHGGYSCDQKQPRTTISLGTILMHADERHSAPPNTYRGVCTPSERRLLVSQHWVLAPQTELRNPTCNIIPSEELNLSDRTCGALLDETNCRLHMYNDLVYMPARIDWWQAPDP
jgi:hypothetical protein